MGAAAGVGCRANPKHVLPTAAGTTAVRADVLERARARRDLARAPSCVAGASRGEDRQGKCRARTSLLSHICDMLSLDV